MNSKPPKNCHATGSPNLSLQPPFLLREPQKRRAPPDLQISLPQPPFLLREPQKRIAPPDLAVELLIAPSSSAKRKIVWILAIGMHGFVHGIQFVQENANLCKIII
ncbi:uncharacterized protein LOC109841664 [Asparagus officinalis]|uniref:uncharacterized protein LOC109841664 n=1 Tax=Asparagus officinalis TaxID=4686 RepID=UPI00098E46E0|nr:uncharacterized protein LOC109841664 [Asparagus officinalis]